MRALGTVFRSYFYINGLLNRICGMLLRVQ